MRKERRGSKQRGTYRYHLVRTDLRSDNARMITVKIEKGKKGERKFN